MFPLWSGYIGPAKTKEPARKITMQSIDIAQLFTDDDDGDVQAVLEAGLERTSNALSAYFKRALLLCVGRPDFGTMPISRLLWKRALFCTTWSSKMSATTQISNSHTMAVVPASKEHNTDFKEFIRRYRQIRDKQTHYQLRNDLIEHLWRGRLTNVVGLR